MPTAEKLTGGEVLLRGVDERVSIGDRIEVSEGLADYLRERGDFRIVDGADAADSDAVESAAGDSDGSAASDAGNAGDGFDVDAWLEQPYTDRADRVRAGDVDAHLDVIGEAETSDTVRDAIGERRAAIEAEG